MLKSKILFPFAVILTLSFSTAFAAVPSLKVHIIDVGQAASAIIEFDHAAILIDAGGEKTTPPGRDAASIKAALDAFFARRQDLNRTLDAVIISHPHIDHTMNIMTVMNGYNVKVLVDNGDTNEQASGIEQLKQARNFAASHNIRRIIVKDSDIPAPAGLPLVLPTTSAKVVFLSGFRACANANNDSIAVSIADGNATALFGGDAEDEDEAGLCKQEPLLQHLVKRFGNTNLLTAKLYQATHHGSANGVLAAEISKVHPVASVISAGRLAPQNRVPEDSHAFQFGHPRKQAIDSLVAATTGTRPAKDVQFMNVAGQGQNSNVQPITMHMTKAVYCTCWDGNIDVSFDESGTPTVQPLGAQHTTSPATGFVTNNTGSAAASCSTPTAADLVHTASTTGAPTLKPVGYFRLSLSWAPDFCSTSAGQSARNAYQCKENHLGLVVHGLWPQAAGETRGDNQPRNCKPASLIANATVRQNMCTQPGAQLMQDEWAKHGTCAFDAPEAYLGKMQSAYRALKIPDLNALAGKQGLRAADIVESFTKANPGLTAPGLQLQLSGSSLSEVQICYDMQLKFRRCDTTQNVTPFTPVTIRKIGN